MARTLWGVWDCSSCGRTANPARPDKRADEQEKCDGCGKPRDPDEASEKQEHQSPDFDVIVTFPDGKRKDLNPGQGTYQKWCDYCAANQPCTATATVNNLGMLRDLRIPTEHQ